MRYEIRGELAQAAILEYERHESIWAGRGSILTIDPGVEWHLRVPGGIEAAASRALSGAGIALLHVTGEAGKHVTLAANQPGKIQAWDVNLLGPVVTTHGSFVAAFGEEVSIDVTVAKRAGAAFFGGAGLFLQRVSGRATALIHGAGDFIERDLAPGETTLVSTGNLAAFAESVDYSIQGVAGCRRMLFGGEGLFMTRLTGPGRILLQSMKRASASSSGKSG